MGAGVRAFRLQPPLVDPVAGGPQTHQEDLQGSDVTKLGRLPGDVQKQPSCCAPDQPVCLQSQATPKCPQENPA